MTRPNSRQITALRQVGKTKQDLDDAAARHHKAVMRALSLGVTQGQLAIELDVSRQAISQYVNRWVTGRTPKRTTGPTLFD